MLKYCLVFLHFEMKLMNAVMQYKAYFVIAIAAMAILAYAIPYGMDVEAKGPPANNPGKHYGLINGDGYGINCDHFTNGKGPIRCR
jgi:hypothetical protein